MPPVTRRCPLSSISSNIPYNALQSPKPLDCGGIKRAVCFNSPSKPPITVLNATPLAQVRNQVAWHISDSCQAQGSNQTCHVCAPFFKSAWSDESRICSQSLSSLITWLASPKLRDRLRALMMISDAGQLLQRPCLSDPACSGERRKLDNHNAQADAALRSFELGGGCGAMVALLRSGHEATERGALMGLALLCAAGSARFCALVCREGGLSASIVILKKPWGDKCTLNVLGLLLNCSSHDVTHSSFEEDACVALLQLCVPRSKEQTLLLTNYACSTLANLCGGSASTRKNFLNNPHILPRIFCLAKEGCSAAAIAVKNLCSGTECANVRISGSDLILLVQHLLPLSAESAEIVCSALQCYCLHSPLQPQQLSALVDLLPRAGNLCGSLLAALCNATLHRE